MNVVRGLLVSAALVASAGLASAAKSSVGVAVSGATLSLQTASETGSVSVRVTGPQGFVMERAFGRGDAAVLDLAEAGQLVDGGYNWEATVAAAEARVRGRGVAAAAPTGAILSGSFNVVGGAIVPPGGEEPAPPVPDDQVIPDDLIVQGSICAGFDCVNNESFGFDTIRLKENNLRIKFEDTSVGSFPANDWELIANDSASGGSNKFSISDVTGAKVPFTVTAGAATNSIFVDSTGRVGLRTSTPVLDLHVNTSNTPAIRLEQNNSGGFTAQTWDVAGNEANFFIRDVTGGSRLPLRIRPGAPTSSIDIASDGLVGFGTASPNKAITVSRSDGNAQVSVTETAAAVAVRTLMALTNNGAARFTLSNTATGTTWASDNDASSNLTFNNIANAGTEAILSPTGSLTILGTLTQGSDRNSKREIEAVDSQGVLDKVAELPLATWRYKGDDAGGLHIGPMAQDFVAAFGLGPDDRHIAPGDMAGVALAAVQALNQVVEQKDAQLKALEQQNAELAQRLAAIEAALATR